MTDTKQKKRKLKSPAVLPRIVILLFLLMLLLAINIDSVSYRLTSSSYEEVTATVVRKAKDDFLLLIPMVEITYTYEGTEYVEEKYFVIQPFFGLSREEGAHCQIYVNTYAPNYCLFKVHFFKNILNWILLILMVVCIYNLAWRIKRWRLERQDRKMDKEKRKKKQKKGGDRK